MFRVDIFLVAQGPTHLVELQYVKLALHLRIKKKNNKNTALSHSEAAPASNVFTNAKQEAGGFFFFFLFSKSFSLQDVRYEPDVAECLIFIQVRAYK